MTTEKPKKLCEVIKDREKTRYEEKIDFYKKLICDVVFKERAGVVNEEGKTCLTEDINIINFLDGQGIKLKIDEYHQDEDEQCYFVYVLLKEK